VSIPALVLRLFPVYESELRLTIPQSPFAIVRFPSTTDPATAARTLITRSILASAIYELWGTGLDYPSLHQDVRQRSAPYWPLHSQHSFRFEIDSFQGSHTSSQHTAIIESFAYMAFSGPIRMKNPSAQFVVFEDFLLDAPLPHQLHLGRLVASGNRKATLNKYTLKKRRYIATTSMDSELALVTANLALAAPGKLAYDPFMGTGSFPLACAHFGAGVFGSDLDGRSVRGKGGRDVRSNFTQYATSPLYLGGFVADLTNTPLRSSRCLDAIVCDPPYGVREGLKVLGSHKPELQAEVFLEDGRLAHLAETYLPPKKAYSFLRMLGDVLEFGTGALVEGGRLCMWMPVAGATAEEEPKGVGGKERRGGGGEGGQEGGAGKEEEYAIPHHPALELVSECTQHFNKWSRRLLTYRRLANSCIDENEMLAYQAARLILQGENGVGTADDLNSFRRKVSLPSSLTFHSH